MFGTFFAAFKVALTPWTWGWKFNMEVYTVLLGLTLLAISISCYVLWLELKSYDFLFTGPKTSMLESRRPRSPARAVKKLKRRSNPLAFWF